MGQAQGEADREAIHAFYALRLKNAIAQTRLYGCREVREGELLALSRRCLVHVRRQQPAAYRELFGISEGARLPLDRLWLMGNLTDLRDVAACKAAQPEAADGPEEGCSAMLSQSPKGPIFAQNWDLNADNAPFVRLIHRRPAEGPETLSLTCAGCLSLMGLNSEGLAVGTNNVRSRDSQPGSGYLDLIHQMLGQERLAAAKSKLEGARRAAAHTYWLLDASEGYLIECTATQHRSERIEGAPRVYTNHIQHPDLKALEVMGDPGSTYVRQTRLEALLQAGDPSPKRLQSLLSDHENGLKAVCRHGETGIRSNGAVVIWPAERRMWASLGPGCQGDWHGMTLSG